MENTKLKCKVVMLPTEKESAIVKFTEEAPTIFINKLVYEPTLAKRYKDEQNQHLYFVSDREIKEDDWMLQAGKYPVKVKAPYIIMDYDKKIEATTDPDLRIFGEPVINGIATFKGLIPQIPTSFIEKYVEKQGKIDEVYINTKLTGQVRYEWNDELQREEEIEESIIETRPDNTVIVSKVKDSWNREEVVAFCKQAYIDGFNKSSEGYNGEYGARDEETENNAIKWIKQNL